MSNKIDSLVGCMTEFVDQLASLSLDWRTTCVPFGDLTVPGDRIDAQLEFVNSADDAKRQLKAMPRFSGGGNYGESSIEALLAGMGKPWRTQAVKVIVLLTDEPALHEQRSQTVGAQLEEKEIICFSATPDLPYFRHWAERSGGRWFKIGPHMDTGDLLELLRSLVRDVATVARDVHALGGGSVRRYIALTSGNSQVEKKS